MSIVKATLETTRIEAGLLRLGPDISERIVPPEANLEGIALACQRGVIPGRKWSRDGYIQIRQTPAGGISDERNQQRSA